MWKRDEGTSIVGGRPTAENAQGWEVVYRLAFLKESRIGCDGVVADIGCGYGYYVAGMKESVGIEPNSLFFERRSRSVPFIRAVGEAIPLRESSCDLVLLIEAIEHVKDVPAVMFEVRRILREGGLVFVTAPNRFYPFETHGFQAEMEYGNILGVGIPILSFFPNRLRKHVERARIYSQKDLVFLLKKHGFETAKISYMPLPLDHALNNAVIRAIRKVLWQLNRFPLIKQMGVSCMILAKTQKKGGRTQSSCHNESTALDSQLINRLCTRVSINRQPPVCYKISNTVCRC